MFSSSSFQSSAAFPPRPLKPYNKTKQAGTLQQVLGKQAQTELSGAGPNPQSANAARDFLNLLRALGEQEAWRAIRPGMCA